MIRWLGDRAALVIILACEAIGRRSIREGRDRERQARDSLRPQYRMSTRPKGDGRRGEA